MKLDTAKSLGIKNRSAFRRGRGPGCGLGKTSGRGHKGARARSGYSDRIGWEGGQMPLYRRMPKRGFNNKRFKTVFNIINVDGLNAFQDGATVDLQALLEAGIVDRVKQSPLLKILGNGELQRKLTVRATQFSASARAKIEKAGGKAEVA
jgi:large subunit ribosomal protein L15